MAGYKENFNITRFHRSVRKALRSVRQIVNVHRQPQLAEHVDHLYHDKFDLVDNMSNVALIAQVNVLAGLGLTAETMEKINNKTNQSITLRFQASEKVEFEKMEKVRVGGFSERELQTTEVITEEEVTGARPRSSIRSVLSKITKRKKEYHWRTMVDWEISVYIGTAVQDRITLQNRSASRKIVTRLPKPDFSESKEYYRPLEVSLDFLFQNIKGGDTAGFQIDQSIAKTPRRNVQVDEMLEGMDALSVWANGIVQHFRNHVLHRFIYCHDPVHKRPQDQEETSKFHDLLGGPVGVFCPILPLLEECAEKSSFVEISNPEKEKEDTGGPSSAGGAGTSLALPKKQGKTDKDPDSPVPSSKDYFLLLEHQLRDLAEKIGALQSTYPDGSNTKKLVSQAEAGVALYCKHAIDLALAYRRAVEYVEYLLRVQLVAAIGKEVDQADIDKFAKYNNSRLFVEPPQPFCHVVRRPEHSPEGMICIEGSHDGRDDTFEPVETFTREQNCGPIKVPLDAAASLELKGKVLLHGWLRHPFQGTNDAYRLTARARQFSCFVLMIGTMASGLEFQPKDALIVRNKDEVIIPLLLQDIPSPKEFKDAIRSLSPEQQRFAKAFRGMQLGSSVFGVCVVQIKPQLEKLLCLAPDALTKEMQLTQDLMDLLIEHQIPSDLLSFDGAIGGLASTKDMVENVKGHAGSVLDIIATEKRKQLGGAIESSIARELDRGSGGCGSDRQLLDLLFHAGPSLSCRPTEVRSLRSFGVDRAVVCESEGWDCEGGLEEECEGGMDLFAAEEDDYCEEDMEEEEEGSVRSRGRDLCGEAPGSDALGGVERSAKANGATADKAREDTSATTVAPEAPGQDIDFALIPKRLNAAFAKLDKEGSLRSCTVKAESDFWRRKRQENLLTPPAERRLDADEIKSERNKAMDLLDALSRSGTLPIDSSELHVVVAASNRFENDVMGTVIEDNINPIDKLEKSTLVFASSVHGISPGCLVRDPVRVRQLEASFPDIFGAGCGADPANDGDSTNGDAGLN